MSTEVKLPDLGDGIEAGDILEILVRAGDVIQKDQGIVEIETDKATLEVPSTHAGKVIAIHVNEGQSVPIGAPLISIEATEGVAPEPAAPAPAPPAPAAEPTTPRAQGSVEPTASGSTNADPPAPAVPPASVAQTSPPPPAASSPPTSTPVPAETFERHLAPAGPAVRRFAREVGVDLARVDGSGPGGRITRDDVLAVVRQTSQTGSATLPDSSASVAEASQPTTPPSGSTSAVKDEQASDQWGPVQIEKMSKIRKTIASKMHESWSSVPRVTNFDDADVTALEKMRQASKADYAESGIKLTSMPFIIKAAALALKSNPLLNASIDLARGQIIYKHYVNIGIAVETDRGLIVPSLRQADRLSIPEIARALGDIAASARTGNFAVDDLRGSTFTISNLGAIGGTYSTPIINTPEVAVLLVGRSRKMPWVVNDEVIVRLMMPLSLSYDHRLVDGGAAARFLNDMIGFLTKPSRLLMAP